jgi:hypothetical protein
MADVITAPRSVLRPFTSELGRALLYPFSLGTLAAIAATALGMWLFSHVPLVGAILSYGIYWGFLFAIIRQASRGAEHFEQPDVVELHEYALPALRGFVATAIVWAPAAARFGASLWSGSTPAEALADPVLWLMLVAGLLYAPSAIMHAAWGGGVLQMLNPVRVVGAAVRLGLDYAVAVAVVTALLGAGIAIELALTPALGSIPIVSRVLSTMAGLFGPAVAAHVLGVLLHTRGDALGLGPAEDYAVPVLAEASPCGSEPVLATTVAAPAAPSTPPAGSPAARFTAVVPPAPTGTGAPSGHAAIAAAVAANDLARAASLYGELGPGAPPLPPRLLFQVARGAAQSGAHALAARALQAAAKSGDAAVAPDALLVLGRILQGKLGRAAEARQVFRHLVQRYPDSAAARHAHAALGAAAPEA